MKTVIIPPIAEKPNHFKIVWDYVFQCGQTTINREPIDSNFKFEKADCKLRLDNKDYELVATKYLENPMRHLDIIEDGTTIAMLGALDSRLLSVHTFNVPLYDKIMAALAGFIEKNGKLPENIWFIK